MTSAQACATPRVVPAMFVLILMLFSSGCLSTSAVEDRRNTVELADDRVPAAAVVDLDASPENPIEPDIIGRPLSPDDAVRIALHRDPAVRAALARVDEARGRLAQADRAPNPMIEFGLGMPIDGVSGAPAVAMLAQQITWLWTRPDRLDAADALRRAAMLDAAASIVTLDATVRRAHAEAVVAGRLAAVASDLAAAASASWRLLDRLAEEGEASQIEVDTALLDANRLALEVLATREQARRARLALLIAIGLPDANPDVVRPTDDPIFETSTVPDEIEIIELAATARFDVAAAGCRVEAAHAEAELAGLRRLPDVSATLMWNRNFVGREALLPGARITLPIFDDGEPAIAMAAANWNVAVLKAIETRRAAISEARLARSRFDQATVLAEGYRTSVLEPAWRSERAAESRHQEGVDDAAATLIARSARLQAERRLLEHQLAAALARIDLLEAVGGDLDADVLTPRIESATSTVSRTENQS